MRKLRNSMRWIVLGLSVVAMVYGAGLITADHVESPTVFCGAVIAMAGTLMFGGFAMSNRIFRG